MRLTRKTFFGDYALEEDNEKAKNSAFNKLGQLEDIEELCEKIVSQPVYVKNEYTNDIYEEDCTDCGALYDFRTKKIVIYDGREFEDWFDLKNYKKTWAFSKDELL